KFWHWEGSTAHISVSHNVPADQQVRVVAVLADGTEVAGRPNTSDGHVQQITEPFSRYKGLGEPRQQDMLRTEDIKEFRLQVRPFQWVRFENIALRPHPASAIQPAASASPATATLPNGVTITLIGIAPSVVTD